MRKWGGGHHLSTVDFSFRTSHCFLLLSLPPLSHLHGPAVKGRSELKRRRTLQPRRSAAIVKLVEEGEHKAVPEIQQLAPRNRAGKGGLQHGE